LSIDTDDKSLRSELNENILLLLLPTAQFTSYLLQTQGKLAKTVKKNYYRRVEIIVVDYPAP